MEDYRSRSFWLDDVPEPVHGTYWVEGPAEIRGAEFTAHAPRLEEYYKHLLPYEDPPEGAAGYLLPLGRRARPGLDPGCPKGG